MALKQYQNLSTQASGSFTKLRAEQVKSEDGLGSLAIDLEALRGQVKDIIGAGDYKEEIIGEYAKVQIVDLAAHFDASAVSGPLVVKQAMDVTGAAALKSTLAVDGAATLKSTLGVVGAAALDSTLSVTGSATLKSTLGVDGAATLKNTLTVDGNTTLKSDTIINAPLTVSGVADFNGNVTANKISIDGDVSDRLYVVGGDGSITDIAALTFNGSVLSVTGEVSASAAVKGASLAIVGAGTFGGNVSMADLTAASGTFGGDLSVAGNLQVNGALTYVNTQNLQVTDKKVVIANGATGNDLDGAGIYLGSDASVDESIRWTTGDGGKWIASDKFEAGTLQAADLSSALVYADVSGNLVAVTAAQFGGYLAAGFGIDSVANGTIAATEYKAGTGVTINNFTASIGQAVGTSDNVSFASVTATTISGSALKSNVKSAEYMYADAFGELKAGTFNAAGDDMVISDALGSVTYSLKFPISGSGNAATLSTSNYMGDDLSVFEALRSLDAQLKTVSDTAAASSKKATASIAVAFLKDAPMQTALDSNFLDELTAANSMIFVNGQLMLSGSDYALDAGAKTLAFKFALEIGDVVVVQKA